MSRFGLLMVAAIALVVVLPVRADDGAPARVVVRVDPLQVDAEILPLLQGSFGARFSADVLGVEPFLDQGAGSWAVTAPASLVDCGADPVTVAELETALAQVERMMQSLEYGDAALRLTTIEERLCGATDPVPAAMLARIPYLQGIIRFYSQDAAAARVLFREAVERQPEMAWDDAFPPEPQQLFLTALSDAVRSSRTTLVVSTEERPAPLLVNGREVPPDQAEVVLVGEQHLVQVGGEAGRVTTLALSTGEAERVHLVGPERVRAGLAGIPDQDPVAFDALVAMAAARGYSEVLVLQQGASDEVWQYNDIVRSWTRVSLVLDKRLARARKVQVVGGVMMGVGAAVAVTGATLGLTNYDRGRETAAAMTTADGQLSAGLHDLYVQDYERYRTDTNTGWALLVAGGAVMGVGIPLLTHGVGQQRASEDGSVAVEVRPSGTGFTLSGRF